ncbi:inhibitor of growth protein 3-like isoform X2 [Haliotis cracherodii]|uniref:inhibitor of growth protein 3-like n=1 Tax=Haliotis asinina TaxID=109174 RepID=UPI001EAFC46C|nr:inhibitor of growth protein 3-like isoform X2 [Haliotis rufescens]XP_048257623.1 inhibitor of growth protein 3-like isoform X2 [Haliotis rufescens]
MLYLEDYLEMIENLPMEMRERLTEMREMDLEVQNALDSLEERVKTFFTKCVTPNVKPEWKEEQFQKIKQDYYKAKEDADEKVQLANHIYDLVDRHLRKLDQELSKFKMELEADNAGITEVLEKRSLELDKPQPPISNPHKAEKRRLPQTSSLVTNHAPEKRPTTEVLSKLATEAAKEVIRRSDSAGNSPAMAMFNSSASSSPIAYNLGHIGAGSNAAIAAAASQAIAATQQMQQGRRTSSMKASYDLMGRPIPVVAKDLSLSFPAQTSAPTTPDSTPRSSRTKKPTTKAAALAQQHTTQPAPPAAVAAPIPPPVPPVAPPPAVVPEPVEDYNSDLQVDDWSSDPNEPRYCLCNQVSYGDMVGCDNDDCPIEWFHYGCVGLTQAPKGKWYCPQCTAAMKRRGRR